MLIKSTPIALTIVLLTAVAGYHSLRQAKAAETQPVDIKFRAKVGTETFNCNSSYRNLGTPGTTISASDFRFYVSDIALIDANGKVFPVTLQQDGKWQYQNVALLDFEDKSGACANGTIDLRDRVIGTVPKGNYKGLQFTLGVPFNLNHADAALAPSPLNLTSLWWNWRGGYKFIRIDLKNNTTTHTNTPHHKQEHENLSGFAIHLGSTGCQAVSDNQKPNNCSNPNTVKVVFPNFDPTKNLAIADLKNLVQNTNLAINQPDTAVGCMSAPNDGDCPGIMKNLGISFNNQPSGNQTFFRVE